MDWSQQLLQSLQIKDESENKVTSNIVECRCVPLTFEPNFAAMPLISSNPNKFSVDDLKRDVLSEDCFAESFVAICQAVSKSLS